MLRRFVDPRNLENHGFPKWKSNVLLIGLRAQEGQVGGKLDPKSAQVEPKLAPSWPQVGASWA